MGSRGAGGRAGHRFHCCFRLTDADMDDPPRPASHRRPGPADPGDPLFAYVAVRGKEGTAFPALTDEGKEASEAVRRKSMFGRTLSRVANAVNIESAMGKKIQNRKNRRNTRARSSNPASSKIERILKQTRNAQFYSSHEKDGLKRDGDSNSASTSPAMESTNPSLWTEPTTEPGHPARQPGRDKKRGAVNRYGSTSVGLYLVLLAILLALVWWGKLFAIACASSLIVTLPRRRRTKPN